MIEILTGIIKESIYLFNEMAPYLLLGFVFAGILHVFLSVEMIGKHLGKNSIGSVLKSVIFGIPLPLCSCGVLPAAVMLRRSGASRGAVISFLVATPITGIDSIFATYSLMGIFFAIYRVIASCITAIVAGIAGNLMPFKYPQAEVASNSEEGCPHCEVKKDSTAQEKKFSGFLHYAFIKSISDIYKWLLLGTLIGGVIGFAVPPSIVQQYLGEPFLAMIVMMIVGIPMYICSTGSIPIAASLMLKGLNPGAALVFLLVGPATNAVSITVVAKEIGKKATAVYVLIIAAMSLIMGYLLDFAPAWFGIDNISEHMHSKVLPYWLHYLSSSLLMLFIIVAIIREFAKKDHAKKAQN